MVDEGRLPLPFALITFTIAVGARWATQSHRSIGEFMGVYSPITGPILEGSRGQIPYLSYPDLVEAGIRPRRRDAACRSDPTFTRASPGLAVAGPTHSNGSFY